MLGWRTNLVLVSGLDFHPLPADSGPSSDTAGISKPELATGRQGATVVELVELVDVVLVVDDVVLVEAVEVVLVVDEVDEVDVVDDVLEVVLQVDRSDNDLATAHTQLT